MGLNGCAATPTEQLGAIAISDPATRQNVLASLRQALGRERISLGPASDEPTRTITVLLEPLGPLETRSVALPETFDVSRRASVCYLVRRATGQSYRVDGISCAIK
jgi:hypothetical protein